MTTPNTTPPARRGFLHGAVFQTVAILILVLTGPVMIGIGSAMNAADRELVETGTRTTGTVAYVRDGAQASDHRLRVDYLAADSSSYSVWAEWAADRTPTVGDTVTVIYRSTDPATSIVEGYGAPGRTLVGAGSVITIASVGACVFLFVRHQWRRRRAARVAPAG